MNQVSLIGRAGANAELKYTPNQTAVLNLSLATSEKRADAFETHWHRIVLYGKMAEMYAPRIKKGTEVFIFGKLFTRSWTDSRTNEKKTSVEIIANWIRVIEKNTQQEEVPF